jgi:hypothetical protein
MALSPQKLERSLEDGEELESDLPHLLERMLNAHSVE